MSRMAFSSMRVGKKYRLVNFGEVFEFELMEILYPEDYRLKDIYTQEQYLLSDVIRFGKGKDFLLSER